MAKYGSVRFGHYDTDEELLNSGLSPDQGEEAQNDDICCPSCGVAINNKEDVTHLGDSVCCVKCNTPLFETITSTPIVMEDEEEVNREEFALAWDELFTPEDGDMDYEVDD
jgi:rubredoxin